MAECTEVNICKDYRDKTEVPDSLAVGDLISYWWFSHDVTKFQILELLIFLRFYFHDVLKQLKSDIHTNFYSEWVLGLVIDCT